MNAVQTKLSEIEEKALYSMNEEGYRNIIGNELELYALVGRSFFKKVVQSAFEYSCMEAEFLKLRKSDQKFKNLCLLRRDIGVSEILREVKEGIRLGRGNRCEYEPPTREEMTKEIYRTYAAKTTNN